MTRNADNTFPSNDVEVIDVRLLLTAKEASAACGKSLRTWRTWDALGLIPQPVRIGRNTLWRAGELREWIAAGCPRRTEWEARS
jgi:predicted DNA-binding transcriptional regulator AlpA